jgi:hypothetical protein
MQEFSCKYIRTCASINHQHICAADDVKKIKDVDADSPVLAGSVVASKPMIPVKLFAKLASTDDVHAEATVTNTNTSGILYLVCDELWLSFTLYYIMCHNIMHPFCHREFFSIYNWNKFSSFNKVFRLLGLIREKVANARRQRHG